MIDWYRQWELHGHNFHDGLVHISLPTQTIRLTPGPGFGDFSHPTTRLVLKMCLGLVCDKEVIDIGCGSGILTIAAIALGAKRAVGVDIDPNAVQHANTNVHLNGFSNQAHCVLPPKTCHGTLVLMNMIRSEQMVAWNPARYPQAKTFITSGILLEERATYLAQTALWGWRVIQETEEDGWLSFKHIMT